MALVQGQDVIIKASGAGLSFSSEACTELTTTTFQVTNSAKRVFHPTAANVIKANTVIQVLGTDYTIDRLTGIITFTASKAGQTVIVFSGTYLPMTAVASATSMKTSCKKVNGDITPLNGGGWVLRETLLHDVSGSLSRFDLADDLFEDAIISGVPIVVEETLNGTLHARAWALLTSDDLEGAADGFVIENVEWEGKPDIDGRVISFI